MSEHRFERSQDGRTVHMAGCQVRGRRLPWRWAEGRTDHEVAWTIVQTPWLRPCKRCMSSMADEP